MKKIILFTTLFLSLIMPIKSLFIKKIDINLDQNEIALTFLYSEDNQAILLKTNTDSFLIVLKGNYKMIKEIDVFEPNPDYFLSNIDSLNFLKIDQEIANISFRTINNLIQIKYYNQTFCIYDKGLIKNINCDYYYFIDMEDNFKITNQVKLIIYNKSIKEEIKEKMYTSYVDSYTLNNKEYFIMKLDEEDYETTIVPFDRDR